MRLLFVHRYFPTQYRHLVTHYASHGHEVVALGDKLELLHDRPHYQGVKLLGYDGPTAETVPAKTLAIDSRARDAVARGYVVAIGAERFRRSGFIPDVVFAHIGWGEGIFLKDVFPEAKLLLYCEFFYRARGADVGFDTAEFPVTADSTFHIRSHNAPFLMALDASDHGVAPTRWQWSQFPNVYQPQISVIHDGIDTDVVAPGLGQREEELVTYVARSLEPHRGFHIFMRAIPEIQRRRPNARIVIVGGDDVSYSPRLPDGDTYRARMSRELEGKIDFSRVTFLGHIPYRDYIALLQKSAVHVYLTYPFVLSWSLLEAMAAGCLVIGSRTAPVEEVIDDGRNGFLVDFFSPEAIASKVEEVLSQQKTMQPLRENARRTVIERYDLKRVCLPAQISLVEQLAAGKCGRFGSQTAN